MNQYVTGTTIKNLREKQKLTQAELAALLNVSDKTVSKWETGRGFPDITFLEPLANCLKVSIIELLSGKEIVNQNKNGKISNSKFYVCPVCGNVIFSMGESLISCCGIQLPPLEIEKSVVWKIEDNLKENDYDLPENWGQENHKIYVEVSDNELFVFLQHSMTKNHYISWIACVGLDYMSLVKLYPEQNAEARFPLKKRCSIYACCNLHGLFEVKL